jgi:phosphodiesterase/alkaline phosphatase D-like protein
MLSLAATAVAVRAQTSAPLAGGTWSGNVTSTSATVVCRLVESGQRARLLLSLSDTLSSPTFSAERISAVDAGNAVKFDVTGLRPDTVYFYGIEIEGVLRSEGVSRGRFKTFPAGAASFKLALIGDGDFRDSDQRVYDAIRAEDPLVLLLNGDLHYFDLTTTNPEDYRAVYDGVLAHPVQGRMFRSAPLAYVWDDHDYTGGNNSNGTAVGGSAARLAYGQCVPHYPVRASDGHIGQAFTVGRVRIIMTDTRSASLPPNLPESESKTMLGAAQKAWFKQELLNARDAGFPLILWMSPEPWIGVPLAGDDAWGSYATERTEIADFLKQNRIKNLVLYCGDMHALAYDDGSHSDYATGGGAPLIVMHAAPMTRDSNSKGGPYTAGPFLGSQQYGILEVTDTGGPTIQCRFSGKRVGEGAKMIYQFSASAAAVEPRTGVVGDNSGERVLVNISARSRISSASDSLIAGFVVGGRVTRNILMRAVGPSLRAFGVTDPVPFPMLSLYRGSTLVASNENWGLLDATRLTAAFDRVGAFRFLGTESRDAALLLTLEPGSYTLQVSSLTGVPGAVLLEVYEVP